MVEKEEVGKHMVILMSMALRMALERQRERQRENQVDTGICLPARQSHVSRGSRARASPTSRPRTSSSGSHLWQPAGAPHHRARGLVTRILDILAWQIQVDGAVGPNMGVEASNWFLFSLVHVSIDVRLLSAGPWLEADPFCRASWSPNRASQQVPSS